MVRASTFRTTEKRETKGSGRRQECFGNRFASRKTKSKKFSETETALIFDFPGGFHDGNKKLNCVFYTVKKCPYNLQ